MALLQLFLYFDLISLLFVSVRMYKTKNFVIYKTENIEFQIGDHEKCKTNHTVLTLLLFNKVLIITEFIETSEQLNIHRSIPCQLRSLDVNLNGQKKSNF